MRIKHDASTGRAYVNAKYLFAAPPAATVIPDGFKVTKLPMGRARGMHILRKRGGVSAAPTGTHFNM